MSKYYTQVFVTPTNEEWLRPYSAAVPSIVGRYGGRYLAMTSDYERVEGDGENPAIAVIVEWPDAESAHRFYDDPQYQAFKLSRLHGARNDMLLLPGLEA